MVTPVGKPILVRAPWVPGVPTVEVEGSVLARIGSAGSRSLGRQVQLSLWWQVLFLVLPFLAIFRFVMALRIARGGRLLSAAVRGTRTAAASLRSPLATVGAVTVMVILLAANVLFEFGGISPYADALHFGGSGHDRR